MVPAMAILPIRFFCGATFLFAGFDKLLDPRFFDPANPASIAVHPFYLGCPVEWSPADAAPVCPCHGAAFDPAHAGAVLVGPAEQPLTQLPIVIDPSSGQIMLRT